jgi:hypothetical protein
MSPGGVEEELNEIRCVKKNTSKKFLTKRPLPLYAKIAIVNLDAGIVVLDDGNNWYEIRSIEDPDVAHLYDFCKNVLK